MAKQPKRKTKKEKQTESVERAATPIAEADYGPLSFDSSTDSATIARANYDPDCETMTVEFKHGKSYVYNPIAATLWCEFEQAASKGTFFAKRIRPIYAGRVKS